MTRPDTHPPGPPSLGDLMLRFLATRSDAADAAVESAGGDVEPHEVATGFRVDPRAAWIDAAATLQPGVNLPPGAVGSLPPDWAAFVTQPTAAFAVPLAAGHFPQQVKDLHPLLAKFDPAALRPSGGLPPAPGLSGLRGWIEREAKSDDAKRILVAAGISRAIGDLDRAAQLLATVEANGTREWRATCENERAALLWQRGDSDAALAAWTAMAESPAVLFNRGMAALFLGRSTEARAALTRAAALLPESSGWHALARMYLALAEIHG